MKHVYSWSAGTALALAFAMFAFNRTEKAAKSAAGLLGGNDARRSGLPPASNSPTPTPAGPAVASPHADLHADLHSSPVAGTDRIFVAGAGLSGLAEIEASLFVAGKTADAPLKAYALQMEREHTGIHEELKRLAQDKGIAVLPAVEGDMKTRLDKLKSLPPTLMDSYFLADFGIDAHNKAIRLFETQAWEGQDPELRAFAERTVPKLREHLVMAQQLQSRKPGI